VRGGGSNPNIVQNERMDSWAPRIVGGEFLMTKLERLQINRFRVRLGCGGGGVPEAQSPTQTASSGKEIWGNPKMVSKGVGRKKDRKGITANEESEWKRSGKSTLEWKLERGQKPKGTRPTGSLGRLDLTYYDPPALKSIANCNRPKF